MIHYDRQKMGDYLKESRQKANLTQAEVSARMGYTSSQFISNLERGVAVAPIPLLAKMTKLYKTNPDILADLILESQKELLSKVFKKSKR